MVITSNLLENVSESIALDELKDIKKLFGKMTAASNGLEDFIKNKKIEYQLAYDYGMGSILICREFNGQITWETDLQK